jgi:hypothetical protein
MKEKREYGARYQDTYMTYNSYGIYVPSVETRKGGRWETKTGWRSPNSCDSWFGVAGVRTVGGLTWWRRPDSKGTTH